MPRVVVSLPVLSLPTSRTAHPGHANRPKPNRNWVLQAVRLFLLASPYRRCIIAPWLEESHRIRGKGLTQLHLSQSVINHTFFVPPVCGSRRFHGEPIVDKNLPSRPNLDHLRRQAKALLAALESGETEAVSTILNHLPSARGLTADQVRQARFRLADAQSAIARKTGFASWPHLARHVEQLRALEGTWAFARLEIDGNTMPASALGASRILIDGDRFRTESPEATYEGIFNINVEAQPHEIDIEFVAGPEAGNWNFGIFRLDGQQLEICLDMNGKPRPAEFGTSLGSGRAYETLNRSSKARPADVTGGTPSALPQSPPPQDCARFDLVESPTLTKLQGEWTPVKIVRDGQELPAMMLRTGLRSVEANEVKISFGGQMMIHALIRIDEITDPMHVDYFNLAGACQGANQLGIMKWIDADVCFCMAAANDPRPNDFACAAGSGRTFSQWRLKK
jgi:uncharacterized protein (TIGR03067 family)